MKPTGNIPKKFLIFSLAGIALIMPSNAQDTSNERVREHMAMYNKGFVEEAVAGLQSEKTAHPEEIGPAFYLGYIYGKLRMYREAAGEFDYCLEINPDLPEIHYNLGTVLNAQGNYEDAARQFEETLLLDPDFTDAMYNCGIAYYNQGRYVDAIRMYKQAEKLDEDNRDIKFNLALAYEELDPIVALRMWENYINDFGDERNNDYYRAAVLRIEVLREKLNR